MIDALKTMSNKVVKLLDTNHHDHKVYKKSQMNKKLNA